MKRIVIFDGSYDYSKYIFLECRGLENCFFGSTSLTGLAGTINRIHTSVSLNSKFDLPMKSVWYKGYVKNIPVSDNEQYILLFCESNRLSYDQNFVRWVKNYFKAAKTVFFFMNSVVQLPRGRVEYVDRTFDYVVSYDKNDCKKYGWHYYCGVYCKSNNVVENDSEYDVFFIGRNKNRIEELKSAYSYFSSLGLRCDFYIIDVPSAYVDNCGIHYNQMLAYDEVLRKVQNSRILYENVQNNQSGCTLRTYEAIAYKKLLVTNNLTLKETRLFDDYNMAFYNRINELDIDFVRNYAYKPNGISSKDLSPILFIRFLEEIVNA